MLDAGPKPRRYLPLRPLLILDASFELICAAVLAGASGAISRWLGVESLVTYALAAVFAFAALGVGYIARVRRPAATVVRALAIANLAGGLLGWALLTSFWGSFDPPGRALLGSASDVFLALGVLELIALRRVPRD
jgi:membrane associated rhomboid family serine protease